MADLDALEYAVRKAARSSRRRGRGRAQDSASSAACGWTKTRKRRPRSRRYAFTVARPARAHQIWRGKLSTSVRRASEAAIPTSATPSGVQQTTLFMTTRSTGAAAVGSATRSAVRNDIRSATPASEASERTNGRIRAGAPRPRPMPHRPSAVRAQPARARRSPALAPSRPRAARRRASERAIGSGPLRRYLCASWVAVFSPKNCSPPVARSIDGHDRRSKCPREVIAITVTPSWFTISPRIATVHDPAVPTASPPSTVSRPGACHPAGPARPASAPRSASRPRGRAE